MKQLINFWKLLIISKKKTMADIPNKIRQEVISALIAENYLTSDNIDIVREAKIAEMSKICEANITYGFDIELSDGLSHHFSLNVSDQLKITKLNDRAIAGIKELPYHADGEVCKFYTKEDIISINTQMENLVEFQTTYFNSLKNYINGIDNISDICEIEYGDEIPYQYQSDVLKSLYELMGK